VPSETRVTPWAPYEHYNLRRYRIWLKLTEFGMWQRHEWERDDGSRSFDRWIPSSGSRWPPEASRTTCEPTDLEATVSALKAIASGHNDAKGLAALTLQQIGSGQ